MKLKKTVFQKLKKPFLCLSLALLSPISLANDADTRTSRINTRIVGGTNAAPGSWSSTVALMALKDGKEDIWCGGTLIAPTWVLTAAHCLSDTVPVSVILGRQNLSSQNGEKIGLKRIILHPDFNEHTADNDIALIQLKRPSSQKTATLATPADMENFIQSPVRPMTTVGWGLSAFETAEQEAVFPDSLQEVEINFFRRYVCNQVEWNNGEVTSNQFCAGEIQGGQDSCSGDSGGPIFIKNYLGKTVQAGIISWGNGCALKQKPGVYTRLANYIEWVKGHIPGLNVPQSGSWETIYRIGYRISYLQSFIDSIPLNQFTGTTNQERLKTREEKITNQLVKATDYCWNGQPQQAINILKNVYSTMDKKMVLSYKRTESKELILHEYQYLNQIVNAPQF